MPDAHADVDMTPIDDRKIGDPNPPEIKAKRGEIGGKPNPTCALHWQPEVCTACRGRQKHLLAVATTNGQVPPAFVAGEDQPGFAQAGHGDGLFRSPRGEGRTIRPKKEGAPHASSLVFLLVLGAAVA